MLLNIHYKIPTCVGKSNSCALDIIILYNPTKK